MDKLVKLLPVNKRYKQLIKEHGEVWNEIRRSDSVQCFHSLPGILVEAPMGRYQRWVKPEEIEEVK
jgi:hypothetical protein